MTGYVGKCRGFGESKAQTMVSLVMGRRGKEGVASTVVFFTIALLALSNTVSSLRSRFSFLKRWEKGRFLHDVLCRQHKSKTELRKRRAAEVDDENTYRLLKHP